MSGTQAPSSCAVSSLGIALIYNITTISSLQPMEGMKLKEQGISLSKEHSPEVAHSTSALIPFAII